jgi:hypothetical protein
MVEDGLQQFADRIAAGCRDRPRRAPKGSARFADCSVVDDEGGLAGVDPPLAGCVREP